MSTTNIEWADRVWNPVTGCTKVSHGCKHCYAEGVAARFFAHQYPQVAAGPTLPDGGPAAWRPRLFTDVQTHADRLKEPLGWRKPARVFVNSMSDLFHEAVPFEFVKQVWDVISNAHQHTFLILTKRPARMLEFSRWMAGADHVGVAEWHFNVWLGVSVENQETADERIPLLLQTPAATRFVSYEPALGPVDFSWMLTDGWCPAHDFDGGGCSGPCRTRQKRGHRLSWVIVGGESGPGARPFDVAWARSTVKQCRHAGVPVFVKQLGAHPRTNTPSDLPEWSSARDYCGNYRTVSLHHVRDRKGGDPSEWPDDLRVREFPSQVPA